MWRRLKVIGKRQQGELHMEKPVPLRNTKELERWDESSQNILELIRDLKQQPLPLEPNDQDRE
jgi:hypothetical protein